MRVPGGDVVQRAAAVRDAVGRAVVLEFRERDRGAGEPGADRVRLDQVGRGARVSTVGRRPGRSRARPHARRCGGRGAAATCGRPSGPDRPAGDCEARSRSGLAAAAVLVPLATGVPLRATVPVDGGPVGARSPEQAAAGWLAVVARAASVTLPDEAAEHAWRRGIAACILAAGGTEAAAASRAAVVLDRVGLPDEADRGRDVVLRARERSRLSAADAAAGFARPGRRVGCAAAGSRAWPSWPDLWPSPQVNISTPSRWNRSRRPWSRRAPAAARDARRLLVAATSPASEAVDGSSVDSLTETVRRSVAFSGDGLAGVGALFDCLVAETPDHLVMAPALPRAWQGAAVDARSLVTRHGVVSFSLRWHDTRPAVLWELQPVRAVDLPGSTMRCGLDESWTSEAPSGEALLG